MNNSLKIRLSVLLFSVIFLFSCGNNANVLPSVSGSQFELLIVMEDSIWKQPPGRMLLELMNQDMVGLPQPEPVMDVRQCTNIEFTDVLKPARNLLITDISDKYTAPKITYSKDRWAHPQSVVKIVAPNDSVFEATVKQYGKNILDYFILTERERQMAYNKSYINVEAKNQVEKMFGVQIDLIEGISKATKKKDFYWITNDQALVRQDIIIYSYPYVDKNTFTKDFIIAKRDSIMKANIPGELAGSYMGTELKYAEPYFKEVWVNNRYCAELRGLWKMMHGASMGGPFCSHTRLDEINQRVVTIEVFVFAPAKKKRNALRQLEAILYSAKLPQDINALQEISVKPDSIQNETK